MINIYPAESRYSTDHGWLKSNFSFSFGDYHDPENVQFSALRVANDDVIAPGRGFGAHPHREMEIVTVVLKGELKHEDNTGGSGVLRPGEIQRMTAGTGIVHSEFNASDTEEAAVLQLWFLPNEKGVKPGYEQFAYDQDAMINRLLPVVSNHTGADRVAMIHQDMTLYLSRLEAGKSVAFEQQSGRHIYVFVIDGELALNGELSLKRRDAARIDGTQRLELSAAADTHLMLIDLP